jgi:hypothetical protein
MDGIHDMGGMDGFGKVEAEPNEPPFHEKWEGRVMAMQRAMGYAGAWHIDHARYAQERIAPKTYLAASYYQKWAMAMTCLARLSTMKASAAAPPPSARKGIIGMPGNSAITSITAPDMPSALG